MKKQKKTLNHEINQFVKEWDCKSLIAFFDDVFPLLKLYDVDQKNDWVEDAVGPENTRNVRIARTVYLLSIIAEKHAAKLCRTNVNFSKLWKRIESEAEITTETTS